MRRLLLALLLLPGLLQASSASHAQDPSRLPRVGWLNPGTWDSSTPAREPFLRGMRELGYLEGRDFIFEPRYWGSEHTTLLRAIDELVQMKVAVIVSAGTPPIRAAREA